MDSMQLVNASVDAVMKFLLGNCGSRTYEGCPWKLALEEKSLELLVYSGDAPAGSSNKRFKAVCVLPYSPLFIRNVLDDSVARIRWDVNIESLETVVLQEQPFKAYLLRSRTKSVGLISGREFLDVPVYFDFLEAPSAPAGPDNFVAPIGSLINGGHGLLSHPDFPETGDFVRGWNSPGSGWLFEPILGEGGQCVATRVHYLIHVDLKGWIPTTLVNSSLGVSSIP